MKTLQQNIEQLAIEQQRRNREVAYAGVAVGADLFKDARNAIMNELEDSDLINGGLLDEIEARLLADEPYYVTELVRQQRVADYVAQGVEEWKAFEIVDAMLKQDTEKSIAGFGTTDATVEKQKALDAIAQVRAAYAVTREKEVAQFGACEGVYTDASGDYFARLSQTIKVSPSNVFAKPYTNFSAADEATLASLRNA